MRMFGRLLLILGFALPAYAQDDEYTEEETPTEEAAAEDGEAWGLYLGADWVRHTVSSSSLRGFGDSDFDSEMYRLRVGRRFENLGVEFQYGLDASDEAPDQVATDAYYGLFVVPTATLFETVELGFPVGYAKTEVSRTNASADVESIAYGFNAELPLRVFGDSMPDLRLGAGWMVYYQKPDARIYGANFGVRYDFGTGGFGNPFAGLFGWIGDIDLWPFGDDEEEAAEGEGEEETE